MSIEERIKAKRENQDDRFKKYKLKFNPFPKSGTANVNESSDYTKYLVPIDENIQHKIADYVADSLYSSDNRDHKLICTITGDYGTGKTQLLLYAKWLIQNEPKKSYVVYINNPQTKLSELIGSIIEHIGHEQFKKYLWDKIIKEIKNEEKNYKEDLLAYIKTNAVIFDFGDSKNPFSTENEVNHKAFLDAFLNQINNKIKHKAFNETLRQIIIQILLDENDNDSVIANYFYNLVSEDFGISKTWETITSGSGLYLDSKVVKLLNSIINIIQMQGFERFYLLVDEFEDITSGRLTKKEVDNYSHNLRTLIDKERRWCLLLAMTRAALKDLKSISPPLVDRLTDREIRIERLSNVQARQIFINYLNLAREDAENSVFPFQEETVQYINSSSNDLPRLALRKANYLLERATDLLPDGAEITKEFAEQHLQN